MLFPCKVSPMRTVAFERVMAGEDDKVFGVVDGNIPYLVNQFILCLAFTVRFYFGLIILVDPPLAVEYDQCHIRGERNFYRPGTTIFRFKAHIVFQKECYI